MPHDQHPTGWFLGEVIDHGFNEAGTNTPQIFVRLRSEAGEITAFLSMTEKAIEYTVKKLRACGYVGFDFGELEDGKLLIGNQVKYQVTSETYNGETRSKVGWINDPNSSGMERSETAAANARRFNAILKANPPEANGKPKAAAPAVSAAADAPW